MSPASLHKVYAAALVATVALALVVGSSWADHQRDDAKRDAVIDAQKSSIAELGQKIATAQQAAQAQIAELEKQKQQVVASPAQAPTIIREVLPSFEITPPAKANQSQPATPQQGSPAAAGEQSLPDAPSYTLSQQDQVQLAQFILGCKQCSVEREQLQSQVSDQQQVIDKQKIELGAAMKAANGGSVWQRTKRAFKYIAIGGAIGFAAAKAH
jgi:hypothetical protein